MSMSISNSLQFFGKETVLEMYQSRNAEGWSLWQVKQFLFKGIGLDELDSLLTALEKGEGNAKYTLKVYEGVADAKQIKERTEADGSFNFKLFGDEERESRRMGYRSNLEKEVDELRAQVAAINAEEEEGDEEDSLQGLGVLGSIFSLLQEPERLERLVNIGKSLLAPQIQQPQFMGNVTRLSGTNVFDKVETSNLDTMQSNPEQQPVKQYSQEELLGLQKALDTLGRCDANAIEHLEKLASIAEKTPDNFKTLTTLLDAY